MDSRFLLERGTSIFTGNELIVKGALESQVGAITGYPGSPLAELFETLANNKDLLNEHGIVAQIANNEALAAARLNGSQMEGIRAMAVKEREVVHQRYPVLWDLARELEINQILYPASAPQPLGFISSGLA